jgi:hypothetical protein
MDPAEHDRLRRALGALTDEDHARVEPPPEVWRGISAALADDGPAPVAPAIVAPAAVAPVIALDERRDRRRARALIGAVAATVVLIAGVVALVGRDDQPSGPELVATAELAPLAPGEGASAAVELHRTDDAVELALEAEGMAPAPVGHHYELWLLDPSSPDAEPISLGAMSASTTVTVPEGVDLEAYDVVDVSVQAEGQVEHSGNSLLRGTLA